MSVSGATRSAWLMISVTSAVGSPQPGGSNTFMPGLRRPIASDSVTLSKEAGHRARVV